MQSTRVSRPGVLVACIMLLVSCGGGEGGVSAPDTSASVVQPAETSPPSSTRPPVPTTDPAPGGSLVLGLTQLSDFPTLAWVYRRDVSGDPNPNERVSYGYQSGGWTIQLPGGAVSPLTVYPTETGADFTGAFFNSLNGHSLYTLAPGAQNPIFPLEWTSVGYWGWSGYNGASPGATSGILAYGVPTASNDVPTSGSARYSLFGWSGTRQSGATGYAAYALFQGAITFDFIARSFTGDFGSVAYGAYVVIPDRFTISRTTVSNDGTSFSGDITVPGLSGAATFEGQFTGPQARELMLRWKAPFRDPATGRTEMVFGTLAGRR